MTDPTTAAPGGEEAEARSALVQAKRAIERAAGDTLWCDDVPVETVCDRIDHALAALDGQGALALAASVVAPTEAGDAERDEEYARIADEVAAEFRKGTPVSAMHRGAVAACEEIGRRIRARAALSATVSTPKAPAAPPADKQLAVADDLLARLDDWAPGVTAVRKDCLEAATMIRWLLAALPEAPARCEGEGLREALEVAEWHDGMEARWAARQATLELSLASAAPAGIEENRLFHQKAAASIRAALRPATDVGGVR